MVSIPTRWTPVWANKLSTAMSGVAAAAVCDGTPGVAEDVEHPDVLDQGLRDEPCYALGGGYGDDPSGEQNLERGVVLRVVPDQMGDVLVGGGPGCGEEAQVERPVGQSLVEGVQRGFVLGANRPDVRDLAVEQEHVGFGRDDGSPHVTSSSNATAPPVRGLQRG